MDGHNLAESLFRWLHVVAGILWIGLLYFFNFVNSAFAPTMDGDTKKKVVPQLMPRALFWFRWGAAFTWVSGVLLLVMVFYIGVKGGDPAIADPNLKVWTTMMGLGVAFVFLGVLVYDILMKTALKKPPLQFWVGLALACLSVWLFKNVFQFSIRATMIHLGAMFGTIMAFNVWFRIWPSQQKIITAIRDGQPPDPAAVGLAGSRSKHNTYMSVPLVFTMLNAHNIWAYECEYILMAVVLVGWAATFLLYKKAAKVQGF